MYTDGSGFREGQAFNPGLPVVIEHTPAEAADTRLAPRHWLILVTAIASSAVGVLGARVWPYQNTPGDVVTVSQPSRQDASHAGDDTDQPSLPTTLNRPAVIAGDTCHTPAPALRLVMSMAPLVLHADEPVSLGLRVDGAPDGAHLVVCGVAAKSTISAGQPADDQTWTLPVSEAANATLIPPPGFVGVMELDLVLLRADRTIADRKTRQVRWQMPDTASMPPPAKTAGADSETEQQIEEGKRLEAAGNLSQARGVFLRLAQAGNPRAAFLYADSYDPISLAKRQLLPPESDLALARTWYRKAFDLGSQDANGRLERLTTW